MNGIKTGLEVFIESGARSLRGKRAGIICHQASVDRESNHAIELLRLVPGIQLTTIFAPEHGLYGTAQDQISIRNEKPLEPGINVHSLYGDTFEDLSPKKEILDTLDILICDLQDVGARYYTFNWTMALAMKACAGTGTKFIVLDRPNPLGGVTVEGNMLDPKFSSFVGLYSIPVRHGMTAGELARVFNEEFRIECDLEVVPLQGWLRDMWYDNTYLPWVMPSPNMPTLDTATVYPGMCLIEGTNLSEGRGTTRPFELVGAPFIDAQMTAKTMNELDLPGVRFRPCRFVPTFHKWANQLCAGVQIHVIDRNIFKPYLTGIALIKILYSLYPQEFQWRQPPYEYETEKLPIDILCGTDSIRRNVEVNLSLEKIEKRWQEGLTSFQELRQNYLFY